MYANSPGLSEFPDISQISWPPTWVTKSPGYEGKSFLFFEAESINPPPPPPRYLFSLFEKKNWQVSPRFHFFFLGGMCLCVKCAIEDCNSSHLQLGLRNDP